MEGQDDTYFIGGVITHFPSVSKNIAMAEEHFCTHDEMGNKYKVCYDQSFLIKAKLLKRLDWQPFRKVGKLTEHGLNFLDAQLKDKNPQVWKDYNS